MRYVVAFVLVCGLALAAGMSRPVATAQLLVVTETPGNLPVVIPPGSTSAVDDILNNPGVLTPNPTRVFPADVPPGALQAGTSARVTATRLNVRSQPMTGRNNVITQLQLGEEVTVLRLNDTLSWALVDTRGPAFVQGWVSTDFLIAFNEEFVPFEATSVPAGDTTGFVIVATDKVNIRAFPTIYAERVGIFTAGAEARIVGRKGNDYWWKIQTADGTVGWVAREYIYVPDPLAYSQVPEVTE